MNQTSLFSPDPFSSNVVSFYPNFLPREQADRLFDHSKELAWVQNRAKMFGNFIDLPRLEAIYGDSGCTYQYLNVLLTPLPWTDQLSDLRSQVESFTGYGFRIVIGNYYRTGSDRIGFHADDSPEMGAQPAIASISLGATRVFRLRCKASKGTQRFELTHGSLLVMHPGCQETHLHEITKTSKPVGERINWTFRPHVGGS